MSNQVKSAIDLSAEKTIHERKKGLFHAKIYTPFQTEYDDYALSLSALNESGPFDVLPGHHNFITMLLPCDVMVETPEKEKKIIPITRGLMHIRDDELIIFLDV